MVLFLQFIAYSPGFFYDEADICYRFYQTEYNWDDAKAACERDHGQLAILDTEDKAIWIREARQSVALDYGTLSKGLETFERYCFQSVYNGLPKVKYPQILCCQIQLLLE